MSDKKLNCVVCKTPTINFEDIKPFIYGLKTRFSYHCVNCEANITFEFKKQEQESSKNV